MEPRRTRLLKVIAPGVLAGSNVNLGHKDNMSRVTFLFMKIIVKAALVTQVKISEATKLIVHLI